METTRDGLSGLLCASAKSNHPVQSWPAGPRISRPNSDARGGRLKRQWYRVRKGLAACGIAQLGKRMLGESRYPRASCSGQDRLASGLDLRHPPPKYSIRPLLEGLHIGVEDRGQVERHHL